MSKLFFISAMILITAGSCNRNVSENSKKNSGTHYIQTSLTKIEKADSTWNNRMGSDGGFVGIHSHGKDLAVHAHQDLGKQRRIMRESLILRPKLESKYERQREERRRILEEKGLLSSDSE